MSDDQLILQAGSITAAQGAQLDAAAVGFGVTIEQLMEVAGWQVARCAWRMIGGTPGAVLVFAGRGNNGGDALVAARHLDAWGCAVVVCMVTGGKPVKPLVARHATTLSSLGVAIRAIDDDRHEQQPMESAGLVIDGLLGTGLRGRPGAAEVVGIARTVGRRVLSIDVPSGLDATTGRAVGDCVQAAATCTLTAMKTGLWTPEGRARAGVITVADVGIPRAAWTSCTLTRPTAPELCGGLLQLP